MMKRLVTTVASAAGVLVAAAMILPTACETRPPSRDELLDGFDAAMRRVVLEWNPADHRSRAEQRRALFDFVYATYQSSAWIPQSLFDSNLVTQAIVGDVNSIVGREAGLVLWPDNPRVLAFGMAPNAGAPEPLKWTVNCVVCHTAEIDGVTYFGAGTKTFDDLWLGESLKKLTAEPWRNRLRGTADYALAADAHRILNSHHHDKIDSLTRARSTAFAASHVELYMRTHHNEMPPVDHVGRGDVKTPPLWHTATKMPRQRWYSDGSFSGVYPLMASSMELEKDRPFAALIAQVIPDIKQQFDDVVRHLRAPKYPYAIDRELAERGRALFESDAVGCAHCHGTYDGGNVDWPGVHVDVGTDRGRLEVVNAEFIEAFDRSPLARDGVLQKSAGYAATPLSGVWANYPYLHNGSVPTLYDLLGPVERRPKIFEVRAARHFDRERVGQRRMTDPADAGTPESSLLDAVGADRNWFNTARPGASNGGHDVWPRIRTDENRRALIEYLKTL
jgi:hypothetical protein